MHLKSKQKYYILRIMLKERFPNPKPEQKEGKEILD